MSKFDCSQCPGYCCSYDQIEVTPNDIKRLAKHLGLSEAQVNARYIKRAGGTTVLRHRKDHIYKSMCVFFDQDERRCTIYAGRPHACRLYPYGKTCGYYDFLQFEREHQDDKEFIPSA